MRIRVKKQFLYMDGHRERSLEPGFYDVPKDVRERVARLAIRFGTAVIHHEVKKEAPENKVVTVTENKAVTEIKEDPVTEIKKRRGRRSKQ